MATNNAAKLSSAWNATASTKEAPPTLRTFGVVERGLDVCQRAVLQAKHGVIQRVDVGVPLDNLFTEWQGCG